MKDLSIAAYSGAGIGLLIGVLMGLALSPTVGVIIGTLSSILAVLLGLNDQHFSNSKAVRIGSFGFACVLGALLGIFIRVNSTLAPDIQDQYEAYRSVGFSEAEARSFLAYERFSIMDEDWKMPEAAPAGAGGGEGENGAIAPMARSMAEARNTVGLYSAEDIGPGECEKLASLDAESSLPYILQNFEITGGIWKPMALAVEKEVAAAHQKTVLLTLRDAICAAPDAFSDAQCDALQALPDDADAGQRLAGFRKIGGPWVTLADAIENNIAASERGAVLALITRIICNDK